MSTYKTAMTIFAVLLFCSATSVFAQDDPMAKLLGYLPAGMNVGDLMNNPDMVEMAKQQGAAMGFGAQIAQAEEAVKQGESLDSVAKKAAEQASPDKVAELTALAKSEAEKHDLSALKTMDQDTLKSKLEEAAKGTIPPNLQQAADQVKAKVLEVVTTGKPAAKATTKKSGKGKQTGKKDTKKKDNKKATTPKKKTG